MRHTGAAELVARAAPGSTLVSNASGPAADVTDRRAAVARRRATRQANAAQVAAAVVQVAATVRAQGRPRPPADDSLAAMVAGHASVARAAVVRRSVAVPPERAAR